MNPDLRPVKDDTVYKVFKQTVEEDIRREYFTKFNEGISNFRLELFANPFAIALENAYQDALKIVMQTLEEVK